MSNDPLQNILWKPHAGKQTEFHQSNVFELLYGGAKGGGKSDSGLYEALRYVHVKGYKALIARRVFDELLELMERADKIFPYIPGLGLTWNAGKRQWESKQGGIIRFRSFPHEKDVKKIDGQEFQYIFIDQVEQFTVKMIDSIKSCARSTIPGITPRVRYSANPGGVSHLWVKEYFIEPCRPIPDGDMVYLDEFDISYQPVKSAPPIKNEHGLTRQFIPAFVWDNPAILRNDPGYVLRLKSLPDTRREALLHGNWDIFEGQFFGEYDYTIHSFRPFSIPKTWYKFASVDYGKRNPFVILWHAVNFDNEIFTYREYACKDKNIKWHAQQFLRLNGSDNLQGIVLPHDMENRIDTETDQDETRKERWERYIGYRFPSIKSNKDRLDGWDYMRELLYFDRNEKPSWYISTECKMLHKTLPSAIHDETRVEDIHKDSDDHWLDAARIGLMHVKPPEKPEGWDDKLQRVDHWKEAFRQESNNNGYGSVSSENAWMI